MVDSNVIGSISFRIAAILICITCLFYTTVMRRFNKKKVRSRLFIVLIILTLIDCMTGIISTFVKGMGLSYEVSFVVTYICNFIYYLTHIAFIPLFCFYIIIVCEVLHKFTSIRLFALFVPSAALVIMVLLNPITHYVFTYDENLNFSRGPGIYLAYFVCALYIVFSGYLLFKYWKSMNKLQKVAMFYFLSLAVAGTIIQMIFPEIICELLAEALGLMGLMIMIERDDYRLDYKSHVNNRSAFVHDIKVCFDLNRSFHIICVRIVNSELYRRVLGYESYDMVIGDIADFLRKIMPMNDIYRTSGGNFYIICFDEPSQNIDSIISRIEERFRQSFDVVGGKTNIKVKILCAKCPDEINCVNDVLLFTDGNLVDINKTVIKGKDLGFILRRIDVEKAIVRGMAGDSFKVLYQPVYDKKTFKIVSAEALLTLNDTELGKLDFSEFMSVAEEAGFVTELEYRMIESVCRYVSRGIENSDMDVTTIIIHIMSVQVLQLEFVEKVRGFIKKYNIRPSIIVFDVSDTIAIQAQDILGNIMDSLAKMGIKFVLVNNDSGFLGLHYSIVDRFDGISIDVNKNYDFSKEEQSDIILKNRISMVKQLNKIVVLSAVDDKKCFDKTKEVYGDYILGNYLSRMVTKNELQNKFWHNEVFEENKEGE